MSVGALGEDGAGTGASTGLRVVHHQRNPALERAAGAVTVDRHHDPVAIETEVREVDRGAGVEAVQEPVPRRVAGLGHADQDAGAAFEGLHLRDPTVVVWVVDRARIGEHVQGGAGRRPERGGPYRADRRARSLVEDPIVVVQALENPRLSHGAVDVRGNDNVARIHHRDVVEPHEAHVR